MELDKKNLHTNTQKVKKWKYKCIRNEPNRNDKNSRMWQETTQHPCDHNKSIDKLSIYSIRWTTIIVTKLHAHETKIKHKCYCIWIVDLRLVEMLFVEPWWFHANQCIRIDSMKIAFATNINIRFLFFFRSSGWCQ